MGGQRAEEPAGGGGGSAHPLWGFEEALPVPVRQGELLGICVSLIILMRSTHAFLK